MAEQTETDSVSRVALPGYKVCKTCKELKLITEFDYTISPAKAEQVNQEAREAAAARGDDLAKVRLVKPRRHVWCRPCHREWMKEYHRKQVATLGDEWLEPERARRRERKAATAEERRARERARHTALQLLRKRHPEEYRELEAECRREEGIAA